MNADLPLGGRLTMSATGVVGTALFVISGFVTNLPMYGDSLVDFSRWAGAHHSDALRQVELLFLTYVMYLLFGVYVTNIVRGRGPGSELLAQVALLAVGVKFAIELVQISILVVPIAANAPDFGGSMAQLGVVVSSSSLFPYAMFLVAIGAAALAARAIPRWLAWFTVGIAAIQLTYMSLGLLDVTVNPVLIAFAGMWYLSIPAWPLVASVALLVSAIRKPSVARQLAAA